jgi:hypothetical protein
MKSPTQLKTTFAVSIPIFILHGLEEYFTGFYKVDASYQYLLKLVDINNSPPVFLIYQVMLCCLLIIIYFISEKAWAKWLMVLVGVIFIAEAQHLMITFTSGAYYPGTFSSVALLIIGFFFWKQLIINFKRI